MLITGGFGCGKTNALLNLISQQSDIDKFYLYAWDPYEVKTNSKAFIEYSNNIDYIYQNLGDYSLKKKRKILIIFDGMIANNCFAIKKLQQIDNLLEVEYFRFPLFLLYRLILLYQKILD